MPSQETTALKIAFSGTVLHLGTGNPAPASVGTESERRILHTPNEPLATQGQPGVWKWHQTDFITKRHSYLPPPLSSYTCIATKVELHYMKFLFLSYFCLFMLNLSSTSLQICEKNITFVAVLLSNPHWNLIYTRFCLGAAHKYIKNFNLHFSPWWEYKSVIIFFLFWEYQTPLNNMTPPVKAFMCHLFFTIAAWKVYNRGASYEHICRMCYVLFYLFRIPPEFTHSLNTGTKRSFCFVSCNQARKPNTPWT